MMSDERRERSDYKHYQNQSGPTESRYRIGED